MYNSSAVCSMGQNKIHRWGLGTKEKIKILFTASLTPLMMPLRTE